MSGIDRRAWARNENALTTVMEYYQKSEGRDQLTLPYLVDDQFIEDVLKK